MSASLVHARSDERRRQRRHVARHRSIASDAAAQAAQQAAAAARQSQKLAGARWHVPGAGHAGRASGGGLRQRRGADFPRAAPVAVPNGLGAGGLLPNMPARPERRQRADARASMDQARPQVDIRQTTQQAILNLAELQCRRAHHADLRPAGQQQRGRAQPRQYSAPRRAKSSAISRPMVMSMSSTRERHHISAATARSMSGR